jgi:hypothetical protein
VQYQEEPPAKKQASIKPEPKTQTPKNASRPPPPQPSSRGNKHATISRSHRPLNPPTNALPPTPRTPQNLPPNRHRPLRQRQRLLRNPTNLLIITPTPPLLHTFLPKTNLHRPRSSALTSQRSFLPEFTAQHTYKIRLFRFPKKESACSRFGREGFGRAS